MHVKRSFMAIVSIPVVFSGIFGFVGGFFDKTTNYFDLLTSKVSIKYKKFRTNHPAYAKFADRANIVLGGLFDLLASPRVWRPIIIVLAFTGFALSTMGTGPIVVFALTLFGLAASVHSEAKQKVNIMKLQREEKALRALVKHKQRAITVAEKLGIVNGALAKKLGFKSLNQREKGYKAVPQDDKELSAMPASLLNIKELRAAMLQANREQNVDRYKLLADKVREAGKIAQQKNELGYTTVSRAGIKAAAGGFIGAITSLGVLATVSSPFTLALGISSVLSNYVGSGITRYTDSNLKQALKNAVSVYRLRPDIPEYQDVEEIEKQAQSAKLERKVIRELERNAEYVDVIKGITSGPHPHKTLIDRAVEIKNETEAIILRRSEASRISKELKRFDKLFNSKVSNLKHKKAQDIYTHSHPGGQLDEIKIKARKLVIKTRLVSTLLSVKHDKSAILELVNQVDKLPDLTDLSSLYDCISPAETKTLVRQTLESVHTQQQIELRTFEMIALRAELEAQEVILNSTYRNSGQTFKETRDSIIQTEAEKLILPGDDVAKLRNKYVSRDKQSYNQMYMKGLRSLFDFSKPNIAVNNNPHDILLDTTISEFAVFGDDRKSLESERVTYRKRVEAVPNIIREAINLDSTMRSLVPVLTILAFDPANILEADNKLNGILRTFIFPQSSPLGSQVISDDRLPATINNPSDNSGIFNVTYYLLFARIGQLIGGLISYAVNSFRDWREGKKHHVAYDTKLAEMGGDTLALSLKAYGAKQLGSARKKKEIKGASHAGANGDSSRDGAGSPVDPHESSRTTKKRIAQPAPSSVPARTQ